MGSRKLAEADLINTLDPAKLLDLVNSPVCPVPHGSGLFYVLAGTGTFHYRLCLDCGTVRSEPI